MAKALIVSVASFLSNNFRACVSVAPDEVNEDHKRAHVLRKTAWSGRPNTTAESSCAHDLESKVRKWPDWSGVSCPNWPMVAPVQSMLPLAMEISPNKIFLPSTTPLGGTCTHERADGA